MRTSSAMHGLTTHVLDRNKIASKKYIEQHPEPE
jgi:hypothetical protein